MGSLKPDSLLKLEARFKRFKEKQNNVEQERMIRLPKIETLENKCVKTPNKACPNVNTVIFFKIIFNFISSPHIFNDVDYIHFLDFKFKPNNEKFKSIKLLYFYS